jgi:hypothetical protein
MGKANIWYADQPESAETVKRVAELVSGRVSKVNAKRNPGKQDQKRKLKIEKSAIDLAWNHFESLGYTLRSVEKDNLGWDLEATLGGVVLKVEVKGLSGSAFSIGLTPNEFLAFSSKDDLYRLVVVTNALDSPSIYICRYSVEMNEWIVEGAEEKSLYIKTMQSATITCS